MSQILAWFQLELLSLLYVLGTVFFAALIRGYAGFGFSALCVSSLALMLPPAEVVPIVILMEVAASLGMLPSVWQRIRWRAIGLLLVGTMLGVPIGIYSLLVFSESLSRLLISSIILLGSLSLLIGIDLRPRPPLAIGTGFFAGIANGIGGTGGLPIALYFLATAATAASTRASLVAVILILDVYTAVVSLVSGLLTPLVFQRFTALLLPLAFGVYLGSLTFSRTDPEAFRRVLIYFLIFLSLLGLSKLMVGAF